MPDNLETTHEHSHAQNRIAVIPTAEKLGMVCLGGSVALTILTILIMLLV